MFVCVVMCPVLCTIVSGTLYHMHVVSTSLYIANGIYYVYFAIVATIHRMCKLANNTTHVGLAAVNYSACDRNVVDQET